MKDFKACIAIMRQICRFSEENRSEIKLAMLSNVDRLFFSTYDKIEVIHVTPFYLIKCMKQSNPLKISRLQKIIHILRTECKTISNFSG